MKFDLLCLFSLASVALGQRHRDDETIGARGAVADDLPERPSARKAMSNKYKNNQKCPAYEVPAKPQALPGQGKSNLKMYKHYLVGFLNYPNSYIPSVLSNHASGRKIGGKNGAPFTYVPSTGFSAMQTWVTWDKKKISFFDEKTGKTFSKTLNVTDTNVGEFHLLSDMGYSNYLQSEDYALHMIHMSINKPFTFRFGESTFDTWTETENLETILLHDPFELIQWENLGDIQVTYNIPNDEQNSWLDWKYDRVLTGRDFDPEGIAVINPDCAVIADENVPSVFSINPQDGIIKSHFVRIPDIEAVTDEVTGFTSYKFTKDLWLSTLSDKVHCDLDDLKLNTCNVTEKRIDKNPFFTRIQNGVAVTGLAALSDGSLALTMQKKLSGEPGVRVYRVDPGDCTKDCPPRFVDFIGFYKFESSKVNRIWGSTGIGGSDRRLLVVEGDKDFPRGNTFPYDKYPRQQVCIVDILDLNTDSSFKRKTCILNLQFIDDPYDVDNNGVFKASFSGQLDAVEVTDAICMIIGTDTTNIFMGAKNTWKLKESQVPFWQQTLDANFIIVCFVDPIFAPNYHLFD